MSLSGGEAERYDQAGSGVPEAGEQAASGTLEIAHVLFTDIVGYSLLPMDRQKDYLAEFQRIVRDSPRFLAAELSGEIVSLPTGDGMALVFQRDPLAPLQCALEVAAGLKSRPHLKVRMGINSGPVFRVSDVNSNANVAGNGINMAQRVMDCGDAGHILLSKGVAETLLQLSPWAPHLTDLGEVAVKHGVMVHIFNLTTGDAGITEIPARLKASVAKPRKRAKSWVIAITLLLTLLAGAGWWLGRGRWSAAPPDEASIAVLPFADISQEKNQAYFAEGLAEELLEGLAGIPGLRVAARASSFRFKEGGADFATIRDKLQVANILQGSVRKFGNRARISVQLIKTSDGFELWHDSFDREMSDILAVQQDIANAVVAKLKVTSLVKHPAAAVSRNVNGAAYDAYLQGLYLDRHGSRENLRKAEVLYEQSLQLDPTSARAWASLGSNRADQALHNYIPHDEGFSKARQALDRARALDANLAQPDSTLAFISTYHDWNWEAATFYSQKALSLDPGSPTALNTAATLAMVLGHRERAILLYRQAIRIDPLSSAKLLNEGLVYYYSGQYPEAEDALRQSLKLAPDRDDVHMILALVRLAQGKALQALDEAMREKNEAHRLFALSLAHQSLGNKAAADAELAKLVSEFASDSPCLIGEIYAYRGDKDRAFEWFGKAYDAHDSELTEIKGNPIVRTVERDPRYLALLRKIGLPA
jgi:TolB-like protein/class 3 adenylate cyclase/cytochrome c-type biogenesis protein CcmH/NrfG